MPAASTGSNPGIKQPPRVSVQLKNLLFITVTMYLCFGEAHTYMILNPSVTELTLNRSILCWGCGAVAGTMPPNPFEILQTATISTQPHRHGTQFSLVMGSWKGRTQVLLSRVLLDIPLFNQSVCIQSPLCTSLIFTTRPAGCKAHCMLPFHHLLWASRRLGCRGCFVNTSSIE